MTSRVLSLAEIATIRPAGKDRFEADGPSVAGTTRMYGGFMMVVGLRAAARTVEPAMLPQSLHCYFARAASVDLPVSIEVDRFRTGRSFSVRRVSVTQADNPIAALQCSYYAPNEGVSWSTAPGRFELSDLPGPDDCVESDSPIARLHGFEVRRPGADAGFGGVHPMWVRAVGPLGDEAALHAGAVAVMSDYGAGAACTPPGADLPGTSSVTLDHAVRFHVAVPADEWLLLDASAVAAASGRGFMHGGLWSLDGTRVASVSQENYWLMDGPPVWTTEG